MSISVDETLGTNEIIDNSILYDIDMPRQNNSTLKPNDSDNGLHLISKLGRMVCSVPELVDVVDQIMNLRDYSEGVGFIGTLIRPDEGEIYFSIRQWPCRNDA